MADACLFCKIAAGSIPAHKVYEDAHAFAFLDIRPLARGHVLVIPRKHAERFEDLPAEDAAQMWRAVHRLTPVVTRSVGAPASTIAVNNGREAGQEVPHVHVHLVPRTAQDGAGPIHVLFRERPEVGADELKHLAEEIRRRVTPPASPRGGSP